jgi:hypothetical protein
MDTVYIIKGRQILNWTSTLIATVEQMHDSMSWNEIAVALNTEYGVSLTGEAVRSVIRRRRKTASDAALKPERVMVTGYKAERVSPSTSFNVPSHPVQFERPITYRLDGLAVLADVHIPYHSNALVQHCLDVMRQLQVVDLCIAGDLFTMDSVQMAYPKTSEVVPFNEELALGGKFLLELTKQMSLMARQLGYSRPPVLYICSGNHDEKPAKKLDTPLRLQSLIHMALAGQRPDCEIIVTEYDYFMFEIYNKPWRIGHLSQYKSRPGEAARAIAETHGCNVAVGHDHMQGFTSTMDGRFLAISVGATMEITEDGRSSFWYSERRLNAFRPMMQGFLVISNGVPYLFNRTGTAALSGGLTWEEWDAGFPE